ncbi:type IX secretion system plug protein domain-containing protein [uncultured Microscilla sp.]|uniref:type IX secretion system plug protein n=1 Tax=uncultured Microscilla sp. TaxID=432653 RepID=UPI002628D04B|nr:type IX secretion system plug protein domain-containing protein [uncultured Microscilla sp.]
MNKLLIFGFIVSTLASCIPIPPIVVKDQVKKEVNPFAHKKFVTRDFNYESTLKTILLYPKGNTPTQALESSVMYLGQTAPLVLEFDDLSAKPSAFSAKLIHCNRDWTISSLNEIEFINDLNLFDFDAPKLSNNTHQKYYHYSFTIPPVKTSGNYLIKVFRKGQEKDLVLIRRFMVYEKKWEIKPSIIEKPNGEHLVQCKIHYGGVELTNPENITVLIRQNQRWDNALLLQNGTRDNKNKFISYRMTTKAFEGSNEFRRFDMSSFQFIGKRIYSTETLETGNIVTLETDKLRPQATYKKIMDFNGGYIVYDERGGNPQLKADYAQVNFTLKCNELKDEVYVVGKFNNWQTTPKNRMNYNLETRQYEAVLLLKQGVYDYMYARKTEDGQIFYFDQLEGNHPKTNNQYEIFVYYRQSDSRNDQMVGYTTFGSGS